jgi:hypothetical protein
LILAGKRTNPCRFERDPALPIKCSERLLERLFTGTEGFSDFLRSPPDFVFDTRGAARSLSLLSGAGSGMASDFVCAKSRRLVPALFSGEKTIRDLMFKTHGFGQQMPM